MTVPTRGVVGEGAVGARAAGRLRLFRYELRRWRDGVIPDVDEAVESPWHLSDDPEACRRLLALVPRVPTPVWGRDELGAGEMWNSNSLISWLVVRSGLDVDRIRPRAADGRPAGTPASSWRRVRWRKAGLSRRPVIEAGSRACASIAIGGDALGARAAAAWDQLPAVVGLAIRNATARQRVGTVTVTVTASVTVTAGNVVVTVSVAVTVLVVVESTVVGSAATVRVDVTGSR